MADYTASSRRKSGTGGTVTPECIQELLDFFIKNAYKAKNVDQRVCDLIVHVYMIHMVESRYLEYIRKLLLIR